MHRIRIFTGIVALSAACFAVLVSAVPSRAHADDCPGCSIGLFDDPAMTRRTGNGTGFIKEIYVGMTFEPGADSTFTGVEFSILGLDAFLVSFIPSGTPAIVLGTPAAPAVRDTMFGSGGMNIAWSECRTGAQLLGKILLRARDLWPAEPVTFQVTRRYPPGNPQIRAPLLTRCDDPVFSPARVSGASYVLEPSGATGCTASMDQDDFGDVVVGDSSFAHLTVRNLGNDLLTGTVNSPCPSFVVLDANPSYALASGESRTFTVAFAPTFFGAQVCSLQVGGSCGFFPVRGRSVLTALADFRQNPAAYAGRRVRVEGQVFVPGNHDPSRPAAWIVGSGARGIAVTGPGALDPLLADTHNVVQVTGTVREPQTGFYTITEVTAVVRVASAPAPGPENVNAAMLASPQRMGSYVRTQGRVTARERSGAAFRYRAEDGSGTFGFLVADVLGADSLVIGNSYAVAGAVEGIVFPVLEVGDAGAITAPFGTHECVVRIDRTDLGDVAFGDSAFANLTIANAGFGRLTGALSLSCAGFAILGGDAGFDLGFGQNRVFRIVFSPQTLGEHACVLHATPACDSIPVRARSVITAIGDIRRNPAGFAGRRLQVEGQVFVPGNHDPSQPTAWIQGADGRGLAIGGPGALDLQLADVRNVVRITGVVTRPTPGSVALAQVSHVLTVRTATPLQPVSRTAAELTGPERSGDFVAVRGLGQGVTRSETDRTEYAALDATGTFHFVVPAAFGAAGFGFGTSVRVQGALEGGTPPVVHPGGAVQVVDEHPACRGALLTLSDARGAPGDTVSVRVGCAWNPTPIDAWGLRLHYDPSVLRFAGAECCDLAAGWQHCAASAIADGTIALGGFHADAIPAQQIGDLACVRFEILRCTQRTILSVSDGADDIARLVSCNGVVECAVCASDGDVNRDGTLSPGDAQCAFDIYLADQQVPAGCTASDECGSAAADVDCNGLVTPGDALRVFARWLDGNTAPEDCFARELRSAAAANEAAFRLGTARAEGGLVVVPVETRAPRSSAALGLEIALPGVTAAQFRRSGAGLQWNKLAAAAAGGRVRCGGYFADRTRAPLESDWTLLGELVWQGDAAQFDLDAVQWSDRLVLNPTTAPANGAWLARLANPVRGGNAAITLQIPPGGAPAATVQILDVRGRVVHTVFSGALPGGTRQFTWNATHDDGSRVAAGLYVVRLRSGSHHEHRKLVLMH